MLVLTGFVQMRFIRIGIVPLVKRVFIFRREVGAQRTSTLEFLQQWFGGLYRQGAQYRPTAAVLGDNTSNERFIKLRDEYNCVTWLPPPPMYV